MSKKQDEDRTYWEVRATRFAVMKGQVEVTVSGSATGPVGASLAAAEAVRSLENDGIVIHPDPIAEAAEALAASDTPPAAPRGRRRPATVAT